MVTLCTETAHGCIRHLRYVTPAGSIDLPVKLRRASDCDARARNGLSVGFNSLPYPEYDASGKLVYVLPGGLEIAA